jgi:hypothetical protein
VLTKCCRAAPAQVVLPVLKDIEAKASKAALADVPSAIGSTTLEYVAALCSTLIQVKNFDLGDWRKVRKRPRHPFPPSISLSEGPHIGGICCMQNCSSHSAYILLI